MVAALALKHFRARRTDVLAPLIGLCLKLGPSAVIPAGSKHLDNKLADGNNTIGLICPPYFTQFC